jgi:hypothetical protein
MGIFDILTGKRKLKTPAPDRLFAMTTAHVTMELEMDLRSRGKAGIVFQPLETSDFNALVRDMKDVVGGISADSGTAVDSRDDDFGYRWMILSDADFEDLVVGINAVSSALESGGYGERVLAAVFAFEDDRRRPAYFIYNYKRGAFYPFVPSGGGRQRDSEREFRLKAQLSSELPIEPEMDRWFPLWGIPM